MHVLPIPAGRRPVPDAAEAAARASGFAAARHDPGLVWVDGGCSCPLVGDAGRSVRFAPAVVRLLADPGVKAVEVAWAVESGRVAGVPRGVVERVSAEGFAARAAAGGLSPGVWYRVGKFGTR